jgi:hypothetical protein
MLRKLIGAAAFAVLSAEIALAQYTGGIPNSGSFDDQQFYWNVLPSYERRPTWEEREIERRYNETLRTIPNRKPSNDPWAGVRQAPRVTPPDRHGPQ